MRIERALYVTDEIQSSFQSSNLQVCTDNWHSFLS